VVRRRGRLDLTLLTTVLAITAAAFGGCEKAHQRIEPAQLDLPSGQFAGKPPRAVLILIHGAGWTGLSRAAYRSEAATAPLFTRLGYATMTIDYSPGAAGVRDVGRYYAVARRRFGTRTPICAVGTSAGGHLALMLAVRQPDLACVISLAGPTDLVALDSEPGGGVAAGLARQAFGATRLADVSPARYAGAIRARVMLVYAAGDPIVPVAQGYAMARADRRAQLIVLPPGQANFIHSKVDRTAVERAEAQELTFLSQAAGRR